MCFGQSGCAALGAPTPCFRDGLRTQQSTDLRSVGKENTGPQYSKVTRSRAVILLGINPTVCQTLQPVASQRVKLVPQSEAAFREFSRGRLASACVSGAGEERRARTWARPRGERAARPGVV